LIVLIANAHPYLPALANLSCPRSGQGCQNALALTIRSGQAPKGPRTLQAIQEPDAKNPAAFYKPGPCKNVIDVFGPCLSDERAGVHQAWVLKTSFSRSCPVTRGQATPIGPIRNQGKPQSHHDPSDRTSDLLRTLVEMIAG
jgi:hypothetical protein